MALNRLSWMTLAGYCLLLIAGGFIIARLGLARVDQIRMDERRGQLQALSGALALGLNNPADQLQTTIRQAAPGTIFSIIQLDQRRSVAASEFAPPASDILARPESESARRAELGAADQAVPLGPDRDPHVVVARSVGPVGMPTHLIWLAAPVESVLRHWPITDPTLAAILIVLLAGGLMVVNSARAWKNPLLRVVRTAHAVAYGDLTTPIESEGSDELALLARALNHLRDRLIGQVETTNRQRETLASIINQLNEGVVAASGEGRIILINPAAVRLLDLAGRATDSLVNLPIERAIQHLALQRMLVCEPEGVVVHPTSDGRNEARLQIESPAGAVHLLARAADIRLPIMSGQQTRLSIGRLMVMTDVTELARTIQVKTDFVANASHELRTPISTIRAAIETLQSIDLDADREHAVRFLGVIDRQSRRLEALASDLLDLHRIESGNEPFQKRELPLAEFWGDVQNHFEARLAAKQLRWEVDSSATARNSLNVNPQLLQLIIDNLVDNAIKFTEPGGLIRCVVRDEGEAVALEVIDTGCGIPPEDIDRVFERFYQVERARTGHERGTGLGLSIVRHAVQVLNATIQLESAIGKGTRVAVRIPQ